MVTRDSIRKNTGAKLIVSFDHKMAHNAGLFNHQSISNHLCGGKVTNGTLSEVGAGIAGQYIKDAAPKVGF